MTGPLLLQALISQDVYLAGSFIMMLSVLTVIGTLLSDLLLAWLDPRIRYTGSMARSVCWRALAHLFRSTI